MLKEFREFAVKGNVIDLAVGVIIGGAFGKIVTSLVNDLIMPLVGIIIGGHDFSNLAIKIGSAQILYGNFIQTVIDFLIISFSIFIFIRYLNKLKRKKVEEEEAVETPDQSEVLLTEIRDLLKNQSQSKDVQ
ncbi:MULTISPECIES: large conductance mechanosensitive channel protein MscL [Bacillus]|uniref:large conductance mechanosensitive channel protein MscL n=1 Tax=Bacillus TaxID=1386 RepID=UPI000D021AA8|nr:MULTISPECIES: large conductance mechanosensitive channel protein MscL [Bacillus]MDR0123822.1 large conductance mechanosensitive channel protein MscL [Bacillus zhangzhouensis]PRO41979.1 large conductance mechanosensitive channel protein MscL [Bacillus sp. LLTC93]